MLPVLPVLPVLPARLFAAGLLAAAALAAAPAALAEPLPGPGIPEPQPTSPEVRNEGISCTDGESMVNGVCVPSTAQSGASAPSSESRTTNSYTDPVNMVPNINGDPCTGQWESTACYAMHFNSPPAVQPRSTLSTSP